jgi:RHS repeat-associated protein
MSNDSRRFQITLNRIVALPILILIGLTTSHAQTPPAIKSATAGLTPVEEQPGAPAGSYALSGFDNVNLFSGNLNFRLPLMHIGGRGSAGYTMTLPIEQHWRVITVPVPHCDQTGCTYYDSETRYIADPNWWTGIQPGYGPGVLQGRQAGDYAANVQGCSLGVFHLTLTRLTFTAADGTEFELRDAQSNGQPSAGTPPPPPSNSCYDGVGRGRVFVTADGSSATFYSDAVISDTRQPSGSDGSNIVYPSGYLLMRDGTRYRIDNGHTSWIRDANGNMVSFTYDNGLLTGIDDSLNRHISIGTGGISFKGANGVTRTISIYTAALDTVLRKHPDGSTEYTIQTFHQLFPNLQNVQNGTFDIGVVSAVGLPDGRQYQFRYDSYANLAEVILPTGGRIEYDWTMNNYWFGDHVQAIYERLIARRTALDATTPNFETKTTYSVPNSWPIVVDTLDPKNGDALISRSKHYFYGNPLAPSTVYATDYAPWQVGREYQTDEYAADGATLLRRVTNSWQQRAAVNWWTGTPDGAPPNDPRLVETTTTLADTNQVSKHSSISPVDGSVGYDRYNNPTDAWEYDYGSGAPGPLLRHTQTAYVTWLNGSDYACDPSSTCNSNANLTNVIHLRGLPDHTSVFDSNGIEQARTSFEYDNYNSDTNHAALLYRGSISGLDSAFTASYTTRGNLTASTQSLLTSGSVTGSITAYGQYDMAGSVVKVIDPRGNSTTIDFSDNFGGPADAVESGGNPTNTAPSELGGLLTYAFPFKVTNALGPVYTKFEYYLARPVASEDLNGIVSSAYSNDPLDRPTQFIRAVNDNSTPSAKSQTTFAYDDVNHVITTTSDQTTYGDNILTSKVLYDGLGRTTEKRQYEGATNYIAVQSQYDGAGRAYKASNPFRPWQSEVALWTTSAFDALGRVTSVTTPDSAVVSTSYSGNTVTVTDQTGKARKSVTDGLGRLIQVYEDPSSLNYSGLNYLTSYNYDTLNDLITVNQGSQTRTFVYDSLKRLLSATNPESGTVCYGTVVSGVCQSDGYDANGNLLYKTDARGLRTTYAYDTLNRISNRSYSDATPAVTYAYDPAIANGKGRLSSVSSSVSSYSYGNYDALGRVKSATQTIGAQNYSLTYSYDLAGHVTSMTYPSQHTVTNAFDNAGRLQTFVGTLGDGTSRNYAIGITYASGGQMTQEQFGTTPTPIYNKLFYNARGQLSEIREGITPNDTNWERGAIINHYSNSCWGMCAGSQSTTAMGDDNGNLKKQDVYVPGVGTPFSQFYSYDSLNRLQSVTEDNPNGPANWKQSYVYDRYGNRTVDQNSANTYGDGIPKPYFAIDTINNNNRLIVPNGYSGAMHYDAAGNLDIDTYSASAFSRVYDAENRMAQENRTPTDVTATYFYDGDGRRVKRKVGTVETWQVYGIDGELIAEYGANTAASSPQKEYGYRNGQLLVTLTSPLPGGAPSFSDERIQVGVTVVKAAHITELRTAINNLRAHLGMSAYSWTTSATTNDYISANPIVEMRTALDQALGAPVGGYASGLASGQPVKAIHIQELRDRLTAASGSDVRWLVADQLGTPRIVFDQSASLATTVRHDYLPFGEELLATVGGRTTALGYSGDTTRQKFTGKERDNETGLDFFEARYYGSNMGHFTSPDPGGLLTQNQEYPQSWNLYEYVHNNPLTNIDPTGLDCVYANDAGNGVESIDHHSSSRECTQTGGSWVPGYANERWAYFNDKTNMFQVGSLTGWGNTETVNYTMFEAGAQTQFNENETACTGGCSGFSHANADWLQAQFVGKSIPGGLDKYIEFLATREEPIKGGIFMKILAGPLAFWRDHWAGMGGFGPPGGKGDWAATVHDYNWNLNGPDEAHGINIRMGLNPRLTPEVSKAFIQSNSALYRHAGGLQGAKMRLVFGVVNIFQRITH